MLSAICFKLDQSKILLSGNGLKQGVKTDWADVPVISSVCKIPINGFQNISAMFEPSLDAKGWQSQHVYMTVIVTFGLQRYIWSSPNR